MKIFIDPGHGGSETGAVANGINEKDINLIVACAVKVLLVKSGFEVITSRETDINLSLTERCQMANACGADFFISVHHNAGGGDGYEVIHSVLGISGKDLANNIAVEFRKLGQNAHWLGVYSRESEKFPGHDYYTVIGSTNMPAIITEYAFLDTADVKCIDTIEELHGEAVAIAKGICSFLNIPFQDGSNVPTLKLNGTVIQDVIMKDGKMYIPVRKAFETIGAAVDWDDRTDTALVVTKN